MASKAMDLDSSWSSLFLSEDLSDVRVIVERDKNFPAHSLVLKRRSPVMATMLESDFVERQNQTIVITDFKAVHMEMFLKFLYTDIVPEMYSGLCELVKIADKYMVSKLKEKCEESLLDFVNLQTVYELCELADLYSLGKLREKCMFLIKRAAFKLLECDDLKCLSKELMEKIVSADDLSVIKEIDVFWAIWKWGNLKFRYRGMPFSDADVKELTGDLLKHVRWNLADGADKEKISLIVKVDDADLKKKWKPRKPSSDDTQWFLNQCDMLRVDINASSRLMLKGGCFPSDGVTLMHALSSSENSFYVVGVLVLMYAKDFKNEFHVPLECSCGSLNSVAEKGVEVEKSVVFAENVGSKTTSQTIMTYAEFMYEFPKPVEVCKNQTLLIKMMVSVFGTSFAGIRLTFDRQVIRSQKGRDIFVTGDVFGIKKVFIL